ncbi:MAG: hypothetical protein PUJ61_07130 [Spirochaetia bacterium]|nr:hypothetical protein [Spirochaetia bacterium]
MDSDAYAKMLDRVQAVPLEVLPDGVHTQEQLNVMEQYRDAVDSDILDFVRDVRTGANVRPQTVAMISDKAASEIQSLTGKEVYGNRVVLDSNGVRHIDKRHGVNGIADHSMADDADLARIEYVLDNYDTVRFDGDYADGYVDKNGKKAPIVVFEKRINGSYYVVEAVSDAKSKKNYVISAYKTKAANQSLDARAPQDTSENAAENTAFVNDSISNLSENVNANQKKRSYNETFVEKTDAPQELKNEFINNPDMYTALSNAETKAKADGILNGNNTDAALTEFRKLLDEKKPEAVPLGYSLSKKLYQEGRIDESVQLVRDMSRALTESGQFSQAAAITMLNNDPEAAKRYIIRELDTLNQKGREKYGKKWTDFELSEADLKKFDSIDPGDTDAIKAAYQSIYDRISKQYPSTMTEKLMEFRRISMLLNVRTNVRNVVSNALLYPVRWTADRVSALGEGVYSLIDPKYQRTQSINPIRSQNAKKLASEAFETVKTELLGDNKYEDSKGAIRDRQMFKGSKLSQMLDTVTNGAITKANQAMGKNVNPSLMETARNFTYWLLEKGDNVFVRKNFESRMASYIDAQGITDLESIPADAYTLATQEALKATFKDDSAFANLLSSFRKILNQTPGHFLGDAVMPFTKTPANLAMRGIDYSPAGVFNGVKTLKSAKSNADIAKGITQLGQAATGTAAIALGYALAGAGIISGSLSDDKDEAQFQKQQGQLAYAVKTPFGYLTYDWAQPASIPIILGVTIYDSINNDGNFINGLRNGFLASVDSWLELSPLQNISDIFGGYGSPAENVWDVLATDLPLSYLPAQLGAAARIGDTTQRVTYDQNSYLNNLMNQAKSKIPGLSETLPVAYDTWGNPIKRQDSTAEAAFANILNPGQFGNSNVTPIDGEISRLYDATGDTGVFPRKASWSEKVGGENTKLDNKQYSEYQRIMGTDAFDMVSALIESQAYNSLSDEQRAEVISGMYSFADALAKSEVLGYDVENSDTYKKTYSIYKEKGAEGVAIYLGIKQNQEGTKMTDKFSSVDSLDLSDDDKGYYLSKMVDVSEAASAIQRAYGDAGLYQWYSMRSKVDSESDMPYQIVQSGMPYEDMLNYASVLYEDGKEKTAREKAADALQKAQDNLSSYQLRQTIKSLRKSYEDENAKKEQSIQDKLSNISGGSSYGGLLEYIKELRKSRSGGSDLISHIESLRKEYNSSQNSNPLTPIGIQ